MPASWRPISAAARLLGTYRTAHVRVGAVFSCESRDCDMIVVGYTVGRIPWPVGRRKGSGSRDLVVFGGLACAVCRKSGQTVGHWWEVGRDTVWRWRAALGVEPGHFLVARRHVLTRPKKFVSVDVTLLPASAILQVAASTCEGVGRLRDNQKCRITEENCNVFVHEVRARQPK